MKTFDDFGKAFWKSIKAIAKDIVERIDFIFDSYFENSIKVDERSGRCQEVAIELYDIRENVPMPKQSKQFWKSKTNKVLLQMFIKKIVLNRRHIFWPNARITCSATNETA